MNSELYVYPIVHEETGKLAASVVAGTRGGELPYLPHMHANLYPRVKVAYCVTEVFSCSWRIWGLPSVPSLVESSMMWWRPKIRREYERHITGNALFFKSISLSSSCVLN